MGYLNGGSVLPLARLNKDPIPYGANPVNYADDAFLNALRSFCAELQTVLYTGAGAPAGTAQKGALYVDLTNAVLYINSDGASAWAPTGAGYGGLWSAGTYAKGATVRRGPFLFGAEAQNSIDPCFDFGNMGDSTVWQVNGAGVTQNPTTGAILLNNAVNAQVANGIYKSTVAGWDKRRLRLDIEMSGPADGLEFGIFDGSLVSTTAPVTGMQGVTGFWGVGLEIYDPGTPGFYSIANGTQANRVADDNADLTSSTNARFARWYLDFVDNGAGAGTCTMTLFRDAYPGTLVGGSSNDRIGFADDQIQLAQWTVTRPTFTNWRFAVGSHTGGSSAIFATKNAFARYTGTEWATLAILPTRK